MTTENDCIQSGFRKRFTLWLGRNPWVLFSPWLFGVLLALSLPDDVLTQNTWLLPWVNFISDLFPYIVRAADHSRFPEVSRVFQAVMWTIAPVWLYLFWMMPMNRSRQVDILVNSRGWYFVRLIGFVAIAGFGCLTWFGPHSLTKAEKIVSASRLGLGLVGVPMNSGCTVGALIVLFWACKDLEAAAHRTLTNVQGDEHV